MVGRAAKAHYRRRLNFLSRLGYTRSLARYIRMSVQPIVAFATPQYDSTVSRESQSRFRRKATKI